MKTTHYLFILDRSGSMSDCWSTTISALNEQILSIRQAQQLNPEVPIKANLVVFSSDVQFEFLNVPAAHLDELNVHRIQPGGMTAMLDGIGQGIARIEHVMQEGDDVICIILTDGEENSSREFTYSAIGKKIEKLKASQRWTFMMMGADFDIFEMAEKLKIDSDRQFKYSKAMTNEIFQEVNHSIQDYIQAKSEGSSMDVFKFGKDGKRKRQHD
jgi:uncharacterized protein YegL